MRLRIALLGLFCAVGSLALPFVAQAAIPYFGPIIPEAINRCPLGWAGVVQVVNNLISFLITIAIVFVAPLMIAYAGFLFVANPVNSEGISQAKHVLTNTVVGIVIALSAWLIVDAIMAVLYDPGKAGQTWWQIVSSGGLDPCLPQANSGPVYNINGGVSSVPPGPPTTNQTEIARRAGVTDQYREQVCAEAKKRNIAMQCEELLAILATESNGNAQAVSSHGAIGLMQLMPTTAAANGVTACNGSSNTSPSAECVAALKDPKTNIEAGVKNYASLYGEFNGNSTYAIAAYNAGSGAGLTAGGKRQAFSLSRDCTDPQVFAWQCPINPGGFVETQKYVPNVLAIAEYLRSR